MRTKGLASAVPPLFTGEFPVLSWPDHDLAGALSGLPVPFYSLCWMRFLRQVNQTTSARIDCGGFQPEALLLYQPALTYYFWRRRYRIE
jgi:hypothetical protein